MHLTRSFFVLRRLLFCFFSWFCLSETLTIYVQVLIGTLRSHEDLDSELDDCLWPSGLQFAS